MSQAGQRSQYRKDNRDTLLGVEPKLGLPSANPSLQPTAGTGAFREGIDPREAFQMQRNYTLNTSAMPKLEEQGMSNAASMQGNVMGMVADKYKSGYTPQKLPNAYQEYELAQKQGYDGSFMDYKAANKGGVKVQTDIHAPDQSFDNTRKLKNDFEGRADVKKFYEAQSAYDQIQTALDNPSAAGSLAAATKFMKILDPGSVVRESELVMAMEASGKLDQFMNTFNRWKTGEKLTENQLADFKRTSGLLYSEAVKRFNQRATIARDEAEDWGYSPDKVARIAEAPELKAKSTYDDNLEIIEQFMRDSGVEPNDQ